MVVEITKSWKLKIENGETIEVSLGYLERVCGAWMACVFGQISSCF